MGNILSGKTQSSNSVTNIANTAMNASMQSISNCEMRSDQLQQINIRGGIHVDGSKVNLTQTATMVIDMNCAQKSNVNAEMQANVLNAIKQEAEAKGVDIGLLAGTTESNVNAKIINNIKSDINMDSISNALQLNHQKQAANIWGGIFVKNAGEFDINQDLTLKAFMDQMQDSVKSNKFVADIASQIDQKSKAETQSTILGVVQSIFGGIYDMFKSLGIAGMIIGLIVLIVVGYIMFGGGGGEERKNMLMGSIMQRPQQMFNRLPQPMPMYNRP